MDSNGTTARLKVLKGYLLLLKTVGISILSEMDYFRDLYSI